MAKPFKKLRDLMYQMEVGQDDLCKLLLLSNGSISKRMMAKQPWTLDECYAVLEFLHQPPQRLPEFFPRNGQNEEEVKRPGRMTGGRRRVIA